MHHFPLSFSRFSKEKLLLLFVVFWGLFQWTSAQSAFDCTLGTAHSETAFSILHTPGDLWVIGGAYEFDGWGTAQLLIMKTDRVGDTLWTWTYGDRVDTSSAKTREVQHASGDGIFDIQATMSGGYVATGASYLFSEGLGDIVVLNLDYWGDTLWTRNYGGNGDDYGYAVRETPDSGFVVAGFTESFGPGNRNGYLLKIDQHGDTAWTAVTDGSSLEAFFKCSLTEDGGIIALGYTFDAGIGNADIFLVKFDANGAVLWAKTFGGIQNDYGYSIQETPDKGFILTGMTESAGQGVQDAFLIKTDSLGNSEWSKTYGGPLFDGAFEVILVPGRGYAFTGYTTSFGALNNKEDVYIVEVDFAGDILWTGRAGGPEYDFGESLTLADDGELAIVGYSASFGLGVSDIFLFKLDRTEEDNCHLFTTQTQSDDVPFGETTPTITLSHGAFGEYQRPVMGGTFMRRTDACDSVFVGIEPPLNTQLKIYPNPSSGRFQIDGPFTGPWEVRNAMGQLIGERESPVIDLSSEARGIYWLRYPFGGRWFQQKLIKY